jgi:restriction system protein
MSVPDFQSLMLPLLKLAGDGGEHSIQEALDRLSDEFGLTADDRAEMLPSQRQRRFDNRIGWAMTYLSQACLVERTGRGRFRLTARGHEVLGEEPNKVDVKYLERFPEYQEFKSRTKVPEQAGGAAIQQGLTPEELLEQNYQALRGDLAAVLLERVVQAPPAFLEQLVVELLVAMGYGGSLQDAGQAVGQTGDGGIDGIIKEDRLGLESVYVQAKRWGGTVVGRPEVQRFSGALDDKGARKGVFITTSRFSADAREYVARTTNKRIVLIDGEQLAQLMMDHGVGVDTVATYRVQKVDPDYFEGMD